MDERTKLHREVDALKRKLELANKMIRKTTPDWVMMKLLLSSACLEMCIGC